MLDYLSLDEKDFICKWVKYAGLLHCFNDLYLSKQENTDGRTMSLNLWKRDKDTNQYSLENVLEDMNVEYYIRLGDGEKYDLSELGIEI